MTWLWLLTIVGVSLVLAKYLAVARTIILEYERGLKFTRGRFRGVIGPGAYWHSRRSTTIQKLDTRPSRVAVSGQEVLSADGVAIKASLVATCRVVDAERAVLGAEDYRAAIHSELQLALRAIASSLPIEELLRQRAEIPARLKELAAGPLATIGIELQEAALRDLTFPGELKKIFTQVVKARQEGLAALEKARGETAALRNLANAAQMVERSPSLMQLRLLQVLAQQPGNTLVLGVQQSGTPIPLRERAGGDIPPLADTSPPEE
jgi:regulator of protease activity HflC (stomatin/prohibitin superfamily)